MSVPKSTIKKISLNDVVFDPRVQRREGLDHRRVDKIVAKFNPSALGVITVSERDSGQMVVLDGMHRTTAARQAGHDKPVTANVFTGLTVGQEAELFVLLNSGKMPSALSKFLARVVMGEKAATEITAVLDKYGWIVSPANDPGCVSAVTAIDRLYLNGGGPLPAGEHLDVLERVIRIVTGAWEHDVQATNGHILLGVGHLVSRFGLIIDEAKLIMEMQATRPGVLIGKGKTMRDVQGGTVPAAIARILAGMHNSRRRSNLLPEWVWVR